MTKRDLLTALAPLPDHAEVVAQVLMPDPDPEGSDHLQQHRLLGTRTTLRGLLLEVGDEC